MLRLLSLSLLFHIVLASDLVVHTSFGSIKGYEQFTLDGTRVRIFKSVPFAAPPIGDLRWKLPRDPLKWNGVKDGTKYSAACLSNHTESRKQQSVISEDCLYLNVFIRGDCSGGCPITVFYHGGAMNFDSAVYYDDSYMIESFASKGIMLVVPAFRLGFTGILNLGDDQELVPSNLGVHDALHALKFVSRESSNFGGDSDSITIMGHSYGATMAGVLALSPLRQREVKVRRLIMMSAGFIFDPPTKSQWLTNRLVEKAGCSRKTLIDVLNCLKSKDGLELLRYQSEMEVEDKTNSLSTTVDTLFQHILMRPPFLPFADFAELFQTPPDLDVLIGSTVNEMDVPEERKHLFLLPKAETGTLVGVKNVNALQSIHEVLVDSDNSSRHSGSTETIFITVHHVARLVTQGGRKAFVYSFDQPTNNFHTDDLSYLMGIHMFERDVNEKEIAKFYPPLFANFSLYGIPSPEWTPMGDDNSYFSIAVDTVTGRIPEMRTGYQRDTINFWVSAAPGIDRVITSANNGEIDESDPWKKLMTSSFLRSLATENHWNSLSFVNYFSIGMGMLMVAIVVGMLIRSARGKTSERSPILLARNN